MTFSDEPIELDDAGMVFKDMPNHQDHTSLFCKFQQPLPVLRIHRQRLLNEHVLSCEQRSFGQIVVQCRRRCDHYTVHRWFSQDGIIILCCRNLILFADALECVLVNVAH